MKNFVIFSAIFAITIASPFIDRKQEQHYPRRVRREEIPITKNTKYGLRDGVPYVEHKVNLANSGDHRLDAHAYASKDFHNNGPLVSGGSLNYGHKSGGGVVLSGSNVPGGGTKVGAAGVWNVYRNGGFGVDLKGGYSRNFGGPGQFSPPIYGVEIQGGYAFPRRG